MKKTIITALFLTALVPQLASGLCKVETCYDRYGKPNCCPFDSAVQSHFTNAHKISGEKIRDDILRAIPVTKPIANAQHFKGVSPNGKQCHVTISFSNYSDRYVTVAGFEYIGPTSGDYHYFSVRGVEVASDLTNSRHLAFSIVRNQKRQSIEIGGFNTQRLVSISDSKGATQCLIKLN